MKTTKSPPEAAGERERKSILDAGQRPRRLRQADFCAAKLPPEERELFIALLDEAGAHIASGWRLRQQAWAIYRQHVPAAPSKPARPSKVRRRARSPE